MFLDFILAQILKIIVEILPILMMELEVVPQENLLHGVFRQNIDTMYLIRSPYVFLHSFK